MKNKQTNLVLGLFVAVLLNLFSFNCTAQWDTLGTIGITPGVISDQVLAVKNDTVYIAFADGMASNKLGVMRNVGGVWTSIGTSISTLSVTYLSMAIAPDGNPWVAYSDAANNSGVTVMKYNGSTWSVVGAVNISGGVANFIDLAFSNSGEAYISYVKGMGTFPNLSFLLIVSKFNGTTWTSMGTLETTAMPVALEFTDIAFHPTTDVPYIVYTIADQATVRYYDSGTSTWPTLGSSQFSGSGVQYTKIAFDAAGKAHVVYGDNATNNNTTVKKYDAGAWSNVGPANFTGTASRYHNIAFHNGVLYVAYIDGSNQSRTNVKTFNGTSWANLGGSGTIYSEGTDYTSMGIGNGVIYVSFKDNNNLGGNDKATVLKYNLGVGINKIEDFNNSFSLYPNPTSNLLNVVSDLQINTLSVLSIEGKFIKSVNESSISVAELPQGVYLIEIRTEKGIGHKTFVKE